MKKLITTYEAEIRELHAELIDYPDSKTLRNRLNARLGKWQALLDITVIVAKNEGKPWSPKELDMKTIAMHRKEITGFQQVGDYQFFIGGTIDQWGGLLIERKELSDFYSTFMRSENRIRLYNEISRFQADPRFDSMIIMVEGSMQDFLEYSPKFNGNTYNRNHLGANVASRRSTVAGLFARGVPVLWCGNRAQAVKLYPQMIRQWCIKNYAEILNLEK
jgi:ERCC4-type nuclease